MIDQATLRDIRYFENLAPTAPRFPERRPLDWSEAVRAADARLAEQQIEPGSPARPAEGEAEELAALICAYGLLAGEVDHMRARIPSPAAVRTVPPAVTGG
jgi:hypothetical protein